MTRKSYVKKYVKWWYTAIMGLTDRTCTVACLKIKSPYKSKQNNVFGRFLKPKHKFPITLFGDLSVLTTKFSDYYSISVMQE